ncbi:outer membrane receptor protein involved in Fe transport [Sphingomonas sp. SORGH_AS870]|uniref:TonB-dependent receptor n=1 Tax=Sphingomonas sp. SORGH_AS_0870 TaxID=3041801 RepID=UPI0028663DBA|nr:TonB-dependent receptor [Sphingomonas sp. SORGH_AS_0870]MDR6146492.1 outer membrane receptor protein involved in Fe transport [Sphingomonas sp. SORGH_AS_0870]
MTGFGLSGNITYSRSINSGLTNQATGEPLAEFPGLSKFTYNASIFFDRDWLNARINYNRRSSWLYQAASANNGNSPVYRRGETYVDAKVQLRLGAHYSVFVEALNLTNQLTRSYIDDARPIEFTDVGRRVFLGAQLKL